MGVAYFRKIRGTYRFSGFYPTAQRECNGELPRGEWQTAADASGTGGRQRSRTAHHDTRPDLARLATQDRQRGCAYAPVSAQRRAYDAGEGGSGECS